MFSRSFICHSLFSMKTADDPLHLKTHSPSCLSHGSSEKAGELIFRKRLVSFSCHWRLFHPKELMRKCSCQYFSLQSSLITQAWSFPRCHLPYHPHSYLFHQLNCRIIDYRLHFSLLWQNHSCLQLLTSKWCTRSFQNALVVIKGKRGFMTQRITESQRHFFHMHVNFEWSQYLVAKLNI